MGSFATTPASSAIRLVLALSKLSLTRMRAVASTNASTVARDLSCGGTAGAVLQLKGITPSRDSITDFLEDAG
jgi:hypothetical protein